MRIELPTRADADALAEYLRRCDCIVSYADECSLEASPCPRSQSAKESQIEVDGYLRVWRALHPSTDVKIFGLSSVD
jgi:hypothetical protein